MATHWKGQDLSFRMAYRTCSGACSVCRSDPVICGRAKFRFRSTVPVSPTCDGACFADVRSPGRAVPCVAGRGRAGPCEAVRGRAGPGGAVRGRARPPEKRSFGGHCALPCFVDRAWTAVHGLSPARIEAARDSAQKRHPRGLQEAPFPLQGRSGAPVYCVSLGSRVHGARCL